MVKYFISIICQNVRGKKVKPLTHCRLNELPNTISVSAQFASYPFMVSRLQWVKVLIKTAANSILGPVVQSIVSLMSLLRVISLTVLADSIYNILIFFAEKM